MKKCPTCERTFDDKMRFCQTDGTPLIDAEEASDPYATMVASKDEIASAIPPETSLSEPPEKKDDEFLEIPGTDEDPRKTSVVTEEEMREITGGKEDSAKKASSDPFDAEATFVMNSKPSLSDLEDEPSSLPEFDEPEIKPPPFGSSPFSSPKSEPPSSGSKSLAEEASKKEISGEKPFSSPIPSPFGEKMPPSYQTPSNPPFKEPEPSKDIPSNPFGAPSSPFSKPSFGDSEPKNPPVRQSDWMPPSSPSAGFGGQAVGGSPPPNPPTIGQEQNKTLAIVSLVLGILSLFCCTFILPGLAAVITGFLARSKANQNPNEFGGSGFALGGMITGGISVLFGIILIILYVFTGALAGLGSFN